jgi:uroporphyrinogen-III synthase
MPGAERKQSLSGCCVWVTRPAHQSQSIITSLEGLGAHTLALPLLDIAPFTDPASQQRLTAAADYDVVIFVSANAVEYSADWHANITNVCDIAVIGQATAAKCREYGLNAQYVPDRGDSEGILGQSRFQSMEEQKVLIVRGHGGREHLAEQLRLRGATVDYAEVYQRQTPDIRLTPDLAAADIILITSTEALNTLVMLAQRDRQDWVFAKPLLLIHARIASRVQESGFTLKPLVATEASDSGMIEALQAWVRSQRSE